MMQGTMPAVSVLVPVYNMERYLSQCMDALCGQVLEDIEIIAVNDGSTDSSLAILREYAERDGRVRIVDKPNSGYGSSLNRGLDEARGEYIGIVEPDDYPDLVMFRKLYKQAKKHGCDAVKCNYYEHYDDHEDIQRVFAGFPYRKPFDPADYPSIICTIPAIWAGIYRRSFLEAEGIRLRETPGASFQDTAFTQKVWMAARRIVLVRRPLMHYRMDNPGSSVKTADKAEAVREELLEAEGFLRARPKRAEQLMPWFLVGKWGTYRWNYERIDAGLRPAFVGKAHAEFSRARDDGELQFDLFGPASRPQLEFLLSEGAEAFVERYGDRLPGDWEVG